MSLEREEGRVVEGGDAKTRGEVTARSSRLCVGARGSVTPRTRGTRKRGTLAVGNSDVQPRNLGNVRRGPWARTSEGNASLRYRRFQSIRRHVYRDE